MSQGIKEQYTNVPHYDAKSNANSVITEMSLVQPQKNNFNNDHSLSTQKESELLSSNTPNSMSKLITRKGRMIMLLYRKDESPTICIGPQWPVPIFVLSFIAFVSFVYFYYLFSLLNFYIRSIGLLICSIQVSAYLITVLINPGLPSKEFWLENFDPDKIPLTNYRICEKCQLIMDMDKKTEHCYDCEICVEGMDHHCPWTSKCIAKRNIISFYIFILSTYIYIFYLAFGVFSILFFKTQ